MKNNIEFSIIIPVFNEGRRIEQTIKNIIITMPEISKNYQLVFIDDGSTDDTVLKINRQLSNRKIDYQVKSIIKNQGKGAAIKEGIELARGDYLILFDADNSTNINELIKIKPELNNFDFVIGSRYISGSNIEVKQSIIRRIISRIGNLLIRKILQLPYFDTQCGFKVIKKNIADIVAKKMQINRWGFDIEMLTIAKIHNIRVKEIPVSWHNSADSRLRAGRAALQTFSDLITIYRNKKTGIYN